MAKATKVKGKEASSEGSLDEAGPRKSENPNRARDHLANERTYLSWVRTSVSLMGFGIVIVRLRPASLPPQGGRQGWELGLVFAAVGLLMVLLATRQYFHVKDALESDSFEPEGRWILVCSTVTVLVGAGVLYYLLGTPAPGNALP